MRVQSARNPDGSEGYWELVRKVFFCCFGIYRNSRRLPEACPEAYSKHDFVSHPEGLRKLVRKSSTKALLRVDALSEVRTVGGGF